MAIECDARTETARKHARINRNANMKCRASSRVIAADRAKAAGRTASLRCYLAASKRARMSTTAR